MLGYIVSVVKGWYMEDRTTVLLAGVDTLIINVKLSTHQGTPKEKQELPYDVGVHLQEWQEIAKANEEPHITPWVHQGQTFLAYPHGVPGWKWLLKNGSLDFMAGALLNNGALARLRFSSEYLWRYSVDVALDHVKSFLRLIFHEPLCLQVAEMHLCADVVGLDIPKEYEQVFVSRAKVERPIYESHLDKPIYRHRKLETIQFSGHGSPMSATIYNKPKEIQVRSPTKVWFHDLWKAKGWTEDMPLWRVECRMKRECLHEMDIEDMHDAIEKIPALWAYCVGHGGQFDGWLRMVVPNEEDTNRWRWETTDAWKVIQRAFSQGWRGYEDMSEIQRDRKRQVNLESAEAAIAGYTATYAAWLQHELGPDDDVSIVLSRLHDKMLERWERQGIDFQDLRQKKQYIYFQDQRPKKEASYRVI